MRAREGTLGLGPCVIGVDPGTNVLGVCLMDPRGEVLETACVRSGNGGLLDREGDLHGKLHGVFVKLQKKYKFDQTPIVAIEEGIFSGRHVHPKVVAMLAEIRGIVMAEAWTMGFVVMKVSVASWKAGMSAVERAMRKDRAYAKYWGARYRADFKTPDEADATHIAAYVVAGVV